MKRILLASASLVAFAGVAAADHINEDTQDGVGLTGSAQIGFNDEIERGFFVEGDLGFTLARELNNGLLAAVTFGLGFEDEDDEDDEDPLTDDEDQDIFGNDDLEVGDVVISLTDRSGSNGVHFGETSFAAERHWYGTTDASGLSIPDAYAGAMAADDFSEADGQTVLRGDVTLGTFNTSMSYVVADDDGDTPDDNLDQLSVGTSGVIGGFTFNAAYQAESEANDEVDCAAIGDEDPDDYDICEDDFSGDEVLGVSVGSTFAGADVRLAYATNRTDEESSLGVSGDVPIGPVTVSAYYTLEMSDNEDEDPEDSFGVAVGYDTDQFGVTVGFENEQGDDDTFINARFSATEDLDIFAGYSRDEEGYVAAEYDLGQGASILASFAETDEAGPNDYKEGTTVALSLDF